MRFNFLKAVVPVLLITLAIIVLNLPQPYLQAENPYGTSGRYSKYFATHGFEEVLTSTAGIAIPPGVINTTGLLKTQRARITVSGRGIRYTLDGTTTPTISVGTPLAIGETLDLIGLLDIQNFMFINDDAPTTTSTCHIHLQYEAEMK